MDPFIDPIFAILTSSPGNLAYHVILAFSIAGALQSSINHWRRSGYPQGRRMVIGLFLLLLVQLIQFLGAAFAWQGVFEPQALLPPLDRAVILLCLVIIAWLWLFPEPSRMADAASLLFGLLVVVTFTFSLLWWRTQPPDLPFNGSFADIGADIFAILLICLSLLILLLRRPNSWGFGMAFFGLMLVGFGLRWISPQSQSDYAGIVRLAQLMAYPLLFALPQRFPIPVEISQAPSQALNANIREIRRYRTDPGFISEFLELTSERELLPFRQKMTRLVSELMVADVTLLLSPPDDAGQVVVSSGYNLIKQQAVESFSLETHNLPILASALRRGRVVRLPSSSTSADLVSLARALNLEHAGHLLAAPILAQDGSVRQALVLILPYSNRGWTVEDQNYLTRLSNAFTGFVNLAEPALSPFGNTPARSALPASLDALHNQVEELQTQLSEEKQRSENLAGLVSDFEAYQQRIVELEQETYSLQAANELQRQASSTDLEQVKGELRLALEEVAQLTNTGQPSSPIHLIAPANFEKHVQQLRQPVKSLRENIQLLLTESSQHSSSPQRKYADRLQASIDRLTMLLDDFLRSIELSSAPHDPQLGPVVLDDLVHEVIDRLSPVMKTRDIAFRLDLQGQLPVAMLDREALTRVLEILLANAGVASPSKSQVTLALSIQTKDNEPDYLLIQVTGFGRETTEGMPLLFSRILPPKRFSEDPARNLAALKTIVEAQQGRIWADPASDQDLTISVLLPVEVLATPLEAEESAGA